MVQQYRQHMNSHPTKNIAAPSNKAMRQLIPILFTMNYDGAEAEAERAHACSFVLSSPWTG